MLVVDLAEALKHLRAEEEPDLLQVRRVVQVRDDRSGRGDLARDPVVEGPVVLSRAAAAHVVLAELLDVGEVRRAWLWEWKLEE